MQRLVVTQKPPMRGKGAFPWIPELITVGAVRRGLLMTDAAGGARLMLIFTLAHGPAERGGEQAGWRGLGT